MEMGRKAVGAKEIAVEMGNLDGRLSPDSEVGATHRVALSDLGDPPGRPCQTTGKVCQSLFFGILMTLATVKPGALAPTFASTAELVKETGFTIAVFVTAGFEPVKLFNSTDPFDSTTVFTTTALSVLGIATFFVASPSGFS